MKRFIMLAVLTLVALTGCDKNDASNKAGNEAADMAMVHSSSSEVPADLKAAENPKYPLGSKVTLNADHMKGMKGAEATVVGAYETTAYSVTYTPTTGGAEVPDHKWVIQEEIKDAPSQMLQPQTKVTLEADHMKGMKGAAAVIESGQKATVYMVDYKPTTGGKTVKNHKWVIESELSAK